MESDSMEVGPNRRMRDALSAKGELVGYSEYDGGHSFRNWSGGMVNGLEYLIRPSNSKDDPSSNQVGQGPANCRNFKCQLLPGAPLIRVLCE